jgi:hypothetical protein
MLPPACRASAFGLIGFVSLVMLGCEAQRSPSTHPTTAISSPARPKWEYICVEPQAEEPDHDKGVLQGFENMFNRRGEQGWLFLGYSEGGFAVFYGRPADPALRKRLEYKVVPQSLMLKSALDKMGASPDDTPENRLKEEGYLAEELARQGEGGWHCVSLQGSLALYVRDK